MFIEHEYKFYFRLILNPLSLEQIKRLNRKLIFNSQTVNSRYFKVEVYLKPLINQSTVELRWLEH